MQIQFDGVLCDVLFGRYANNHRAAVGLRDAETGEPMATATINITDQDHLLGPDEVFVNHDSVALELLPDLIAGGIFEDTGRRGSSGYHDEFVIARLLVTDQLPPVQEQLAPDPSDSDDLPVINPLPALERGSRS